ncbi:hypothetical protein BH09ACT8_BH09ACT8_15240 [soil metagenome]
MFWYGQHMSWWGYAGMALGMAAFWILVIGGLAAVVKYLFNDHARRYRPSESGSPGAILAARFARGEISEMEYRDRLTVLQQDGLR